MIASDNDAGDKFFAGINHTGEQLSPVTTPENKKYAKIPSLGVKYTQLSSLQKMKKIIPENFSFIAGVVDTLTNIHSRLSSRIFEKYRNDPNGILRGQGDTDLRKKPEVENLVSDSL
jgi:hypothetical protein